MIKHADNFKSTRLSICRWLISFALGCLALSVGAQTQIPYNGNSHIEMKQSANTYTWVPAQSGPGKGVVFQSGAGISTVEPKMTGQTSLPYQHKQAAARLTFSAPLNTQTLASGVSGAMAGAAAAGLSSGNPYLAMSALAAGIFGPPLISYLAAKGYEYFSLDNGNIVLNQFDPDASRMMSDGFAYCAPASFNNSAGCHQASYRFETSHDAIQHLLNNANVDFFSATQGDCQVDGLAVNCRWFGQRRTVVVVKDESYPSSCPAGSYYINNQCTDVLASITKSLPDFESELASDMANHWDSRHAQIAAAAMAAGIFRNGNIFSDDPTVTGPGSVPISETVGQWPVNVLPGTTEIASPGHTGQTDPGTQTKTDTTVAKNSFDKNTMTTSTQTTSKTSVTNNITNNTSTSVTTNITQSDEAPPKEEEKSDHCKENKDTLGCAELDEVEQDLPQKQIDITYEYTSLFGNGSCPADKHLTTRYGQSLKVWDWQASCDHIVTFFQPVLLACCAFAAFVIVAAGGKE